MIEQYPVSSFTIKINHQFNHHPLVWSLIFCLFCSIVFLNKQVSCNGESDKLDVDEIKQSEALAYTEQYQNHLKKIGENLVQRFGDSVKNALAPARNYYTLVNRYHVWFKNYKNLEKASKGKMKSASDVLREEYARVDKILYEEECSSSDPKDVSDDSPPGYEEKLESIDFVFNVLRKVIDILEESLEKLESEQGLKVKKPENMGLKFLLQDFPLDDEHDGKGELSSEVNEISEVDEEQVKSAMERVKRSVLKAATNAVANEAVVVANLAIVSTAINSLSSLSYLAPIVTLLGSANVPLSVWYLRNLELRAGLAVINRVNPLSFLNCNLKSRKDENQIN